MALNDSAIEGELLCFPRQIRWLDILNVFSRTKVVRGGNFIPKVSGFARIRLVSVSLRLRSDINKGRSLGGTTFFEQC